MKRIRRLVFGERLKKPLDGHPFTNIISSLLLQFTTANTFLNLIIYYYFLE